MSRGNICFDIRTTNFYQPGDYKFIDTNGDGKIFMDDMIYAGSALPTIREVS